MKTTAAQSIIQYLHQLFGNRVEGEVSDAELLGRFINDQDQSAFSVLLQRHGPMVLGVCRRVLRQEADAEDAFQATFLALARKPRSVRDHARVGNWLFSVARNVALKVRAMNSNRNANERKAAVVLKDRGSASVDPALDLPLDEVLDEELAQLPDRYRMAIVLCDLEGRTLRQAAQQLAAPQGTVASQLRRGRELLARRLARRGITSAGAAVIAAVAARAANAAVPHSLFEATLKGAAHPAVPLVISERVAMLIDTALKGVLVARLQRVAVVVGIVLAGFAAGLALIAFAGTVPPQVEAQQATARNEPPAAVQAKGKVPAPEKKSAPVGDPVAGQLPVGKEAAEKQLSETQLAQKQLLEKELGLLRGTWEMAYVETAGKKKIVACKVLLVCDGTKWKEVFLVPNSPVAFTNINIRSSDPNFSVRTSSNAGSTPRTDGEGTFAIDLSSGPAKVIHYTVKLGSGKETRVAAQYELRNGELRIAIPDLVARLPGNFMAELMAISKNQQSHSVFRSLQPEKAMGVDNQPRQASSIIGYRRVSKTPQ